MKALVYHRYGGIKQLQLEEVEKPVPADNEVLIKVVAAGLNPWDVDKLLGRPLLVRMGGIFRPTHKILGADVSGVVEAVGANVQEFKVGDSVYGDLSEGQWGAFSEYVCAGKKQLRKKPEFLSHQEAAALPQAGVMALQALTEKLEVDEQTKVLFNGAGGGVGSIGIQIAKSMGAEVTAVDRTEKFSFLSEIGADDLIDYRIDDFTKSGEKYDLIIDVVFNRSSVSALRSLTPNGRYLIVGGKIGLLFRVMLTSLLLRLFTKKRINLLIHRPNCNLEQLEELFERGEFQLKIHNTYSLKEAHKGFMELRAGSVKGKVVVVMPD